MSAVKNNVVFDVRLLITTMRMENFALSFASAATHYWEN